MRDLIKRFRITNGRHFKLKHHDPADTGRITSKAEAAELLERGLDRLRDQQEKLYAEGSWAVLLILQALDAAGKDSIVEHVMSGVNPQGCEVSSFKAPSAEELAHDFLWRTTLRLPGRGHIGVFNRSYYEEVLVVRVHPEILGGQHLPPALVSRHLWDERFEDIVAYERHLARNGVAILKFFLHISKAEQKRQFLQRLDTPAKNWKFSSGDVRERAHWRDYMAAYEDMIRHTATPAAPWYVVPADHKWFARLVVAEALVDTMKRLHLHFPEIDREKKKELQSAARALRRTGA
ncbi:MAG: polyphosphate kinase 2 family protein [Vicinamibacterales bacterium]